NNPDFAQFIQDECVNQGVWIRPFGKLIYSIVAYTITNEELNKICDAMIYAVKKANIQFKNMEQDR
ncbi:adenosylmethionine--8-amino-7-oxononanoate aminotransferase BioA, partial [Aliarcobacter skirrowii CCUG 10374]